MRAKDLPVIPSALPLSPEAIRAAIRGRPLTPANMLQKSLIKVNDKLEAKEKKFFSHQGMICATEEVEDHKVQLRAAELVLQIAGLTQTQQIKPQEPKVTLEIDAKTGTMRLVIGSDSIEGEIADATAARAAFAEDFVEKPSSVPFFIEPAVADAELGDSSDSDEDPEYINVPKGTLPDAVRQALFGEPKVNGGQDG